MKKNQTALVSAALATLLVAGASYAADAKKGKAAGKPTAAAAEKGECSGVNECKAKGECGGANHDCGGKNECKGKGWISLTEKECLDKKGTFKISKGHHGHSH